jgi:hypothetical protein
MRQQAYQELAKGIWYDIQHSNVVQDALKAGIPMPRTLTKQECLDGEEACSRKLSTRKGHAGGLHQVHLWDCLIHAKDSGNKERCKEILKKIEREGQKSTWRRINRAIDDPSLGAVPFVQQMEHREVVNIYKTEEMNTEIQVTTKKRFDLLMSAPITMTSLWEFLGFLSD